MLHKLSILFALTIVGCSQSAERPSSTTTSQAAIISVQLPAGFSVIEQQPDGYFIRLASTERASSATIRALAATFNDTFDRVDLCLDVARERGDEYASIIDSQVFDHENDIIYSLK